jgi:pyrroloquinoline-quinone synthase
MTESTGPFRDQLQAAVNARHSRMNPFTEKWVNGELTRAQLGAWVCQHYQYVSQFPRWCATVYGDCPDADARDFLLENIVEEESGVKHVDLLIRFGEACGVSRHDVETARQLPTTRALTAWCYETARRPFHVAAAGLLVGLESQVPGIYRRNLPPLKTHYGFNDREVEFFAIHIEADEVHGERGYQIVERHCTTDAMRDEALDQVRQAAEMRWQYMSGLYRAYVAKEEL